MPGHSFLRSAQMGKEGTPGQAVAATSVWRGGNCRRRYPGRIRHRDERVAMLPRRVDDIYVPMQGALMQVAEGPISFSQMRYIAEAGVELESPTQDGGGGSGYIYTYNFGTTAAKTLRTFTWEVGSDELVREAEYMFVREFTLSGAEDEALMMSAIWEGRQWSDSSFTPDLNPLAIEDMLFNNCVVYLDALTGTIGNTPVAQVITGFRAEVVTGAIARRTADGNLYFTTHMWNRPVITGNLVFIHGSELETEMANAEAGTGKLLRIKCEGSALTTPGTGYSKVTMIWDMAVSWEELPDLSEQQGLETMELPFNAGYSQDATLFSQMVIVVEESSLP